MNSAKRLLTAIELLLVTPATLFMVALVVREWQPAPYEPAQSARRLVEWYAARPLLCLDIFLIALPLAALVFGTTTVLRRWRTDAELRRGAFEALGFCRRHLEVLLTTGATLTAGAILAIVALHMITD